MPIAGVAAVVGGILGFLVAPLHALAYFATGEPAGLLPWREAGHAALRPLLEWSNPDVVYTSYGKVALAVFAGLTAGLFGLRASRIRQAHGAERSGFHVAAVGYPLLLVGILVEYWTPLLEFGFIALSVPGILLTLIGSTLLGIGRLRSHQEPRAAAWLLAVSFPATVATTAIIGHLVVGLAVLYAAWILIGWRLARLGAASSPAAEANI